MCDIRCFVDTAINCKSISDRVELDISGDGGFYVQWRVREGKYRYVMHVPENKTKLGFATKKTLLHETGHILFNEMYIADPANLLKVLSRMRKKRLFSLLQGWWYWNPVLRAIRIKLGFSVKLEYAKNDEYDDGSLAPEYFTRGDNEFFCDYFAVYEAIPTTLV